MNSRGVAVGPALVRVANVRREKFQKAKGGAFAGDGDQHRHDMHARVTDVLVAIE